MTQAHTWPNPEFVHLRGKEAVEHVRRHGGTLLSVPRGVKGAPFKITLDDADARMQDPGFDAYNGLMAKVPLRDYLDRVVEDQLGADVEDPEILATTPFGRGFEGLIEPTGIECNSIILVLLDAPAYGTNRHRAAQGTWALSFLYGSGDGECQSNWAIAKGFHGIAEAMWQEHEARAAEEAALNDRLLAAEGEGF
jgi:hypothetical protein